MVLTVSVPVQANKDNICDGSSVLAMQRKHRNGNANQLWKYDEQTGFISIFATDSINTGSKLYFKPLLVYTTKSYEPAIYQA